MLIPFGVFSAAGAGGGAAAGSYELISTTILGSTTASVTFTNGGAWAAYKHLQIRVTARSSSAAANDSIGIRFNSDTGSNYAEHVLYGNGSSVLSGAGTSQTFASGMTMAGDGAAANLFGAGVIDILDFSSSSKNTTLRSLSGNLGQNFIQLRSGLWNNTAAITSILLYSANGNNLLTGSRFSIYGIKGA